MRLPARSPQPGPPGPPRPRIAAAVPLRILGFLLLALAIIVPGCQALISGIASTTPPAGGAVLLARGAAHPYDPYGADR